jgi:hypothetical protein
MNTQAETLLFGRVTDGSGRVAGRVEPQKTPVAIGVRTGGRLKSPPEAYPISANLFSCAFDRFVLMASPMLCMIKLGSVRTGIC